MEVTLKLYAWLADLLPANRQSNRAVVEVGQGETVAGLLRRCQRSALPVLLQLC